MGDVDIRTLQRAIEGSPNDFIVHQQLENALRRKYGGLVAEQDVLGFVSDFNARMFYIVETESSYIIFNVLNIRNSQGHGPSTNVTVQWSKGLLENGHRYSQDAWQARLKKIGWELPDSQLWFHTLSSLYLFHRGQQAALIKNIRDIFQIFMKVGAMTGSRVTSQRLPNSFTRFRDIFQHRYDTEYEYSITIEETHPETSAQLQSERIWQITREQLELVAGALLGTDLKTKEEVKKWFGTDLLGRDPFPYDNPSELTTRNIIIDNLNGANFKSDIALDKPAFGIRFFR
ncbi:hypothetical protein HY489_05730 [Candidatus Woesearchaeota archaeon]|nr:hypothetical protein [Candidatus Woesearchaeota archaeon]